MQKHLIKGDPSQSLMAITRKCIVLQIWPLWSTLHRTPNRAGKKCGWSNSKRKRPPNWPTYDPGIIILLLTYFSGVFDSDMYYLFIYLFFWSGQWHVLYVMTYDLWLMSCFLKIKIKYIIWVLKKHLCKFFLFVLE